MLLFVGMLLGSNLWAASVEEAGVVEIAPSLSDQDEKAWAELETKRNTPAFAKALQGWLELHPHGPLAARALVEEAALAENLLEAGATLRRARGEGDKSVWGSVASLELAKLEYAQGREEAALLAIDEADDWPRSDELEPDWLFWRGQIRLSLKGVQRARGDLKRFASSYPKHPKAPMALLGVAECDSVLKNDDEALAGFENIYKDPASEFGAQALWGAATLRQRRNEWAEAKALFLRLKAQYPASFEANAAKERLTHLEKIPAALATPTRAAKNGASILYVQVGAFSKKESASRLHLTLKKRGYPAHLMGRNLGTRTLYLVKVGPFKSNSAAEVTAHRLKKREKLPYRIIKEPQ